MHTNAYSEGGGGLNMTKHLVCRFIEIATISLTFKSKTYIINGRPPMYI